MERNSQSEKSGDERTFMSLTYAFPFLAFLLLSPAADVSGSEERYS